MQDESSYVSESDMAAQSRTFNTFLLGTMLAMLATPVLAYAGPGAGLSMIGSLVALAMAMLAAIFGFVWFPVKRLLRNRRASQADAASIAPNDQQF
jgi:predicted lipid-binding transport protein (Tim44 family)